VVILVAVNNMIPWGLLGQGVKAGLEIYKNKKAADVAMSEAQLMHVEKMKRGEIEFSGKISENQKSDWKDEFVPYHYFISSYFC
jgi:hypothetical protein